jgi:hypothetical protein
MKNVKLDSNERGWFSKEAFKLVGEVYQLEGKNKKVMYTIEGNWND